MHVGNATARQSPQPRPFSLPSRNVFEILIGSSQGVLVPYLLLDSGALVMEKLPTHLVPKRPQSHGLSRLVLLGAITLTAVYTSLTLAWHWQNVKVTNLPINSEEIVQRCRALSLEPGPPANFHSRTASDRFVAGTPPTLVRNATIWTGRDSGLEVIKGDVLFDKGLIQVVGEISPSMLRKYTNLVTIEAAGAWVSPGYSQFIVHFDRR